MIAILTKMTKRIAVQHVKKQLSMKSFRCNFDWKGQRSSKLDETWTVFTRKKLGRLWCDPQFAQKCFHFTRDLSDLYLFWLVQSQFWISLEVEPALLRICLDPVSTLWIGSKLEQMRNKAYKKTTFEGDIELSALAPPPTSKDAAVIKRRNFKQFFASVVVHASTQRIRQLNIS